MVLSETQWAIVRRAAKYTNGTRVPRVQEVEALKALQALVRTLDALDASTSQPGPTAAPASGGREKARAL
jgi:hypothetical protein